MTIGSLLQPYVLRVEAALDSRLQHTSIEPRLQQAMRYALFNGGKRIRPCLVYLVNELLDGDNVEADLPACAIEAVHSYSLVHDDLPAMDDDDLRRGKPTCHIAFDEPTAVLAGDALQAIAFEWLAGDASTLAADIRLRAVALLARAAGDRGMVAGQAFDLAHVGRPLELDQLQRMHRHKTGALLTAAVELGALSAGVSAGERYDALRRYGDAIGLAFQVQDDILDIEGDTQTLGKPQGSDLAQNKPTFPALLGLDGARARLRALHADALRALEPFGEHAGSLRALADYIVARDH
ncbi:(2E,6E)-farnesyl diphosphate synthase [Marinobacterium nitratireducens]|uniref:(2E,6E)-farnesyl diphosphate synthase n=1 Tax=Marinobacterium nitratireducens TaxID=518897 RepID=A0A917Z8T7_9GAMM|nr:farnesyl diphosphate synthase [Marinobacterium nitratireducens]GGO78413.1 (2E,6E)-farnesyl diphosphate synthase [Marinobacterium nitratireducens]